MVWSEILQYVLAQNQSRPQLTMQGVIELRLNHIMRTMKYRRIISDKRAALNH